MELTLTGIGIILICVTWQFMWRPAMLDTTRDHLFDLRDRIIREYFLKKYGTLENKHYVALRSLVNAHLRHTESLSVPRIAYVAMFGYSHPESEAYIRDRLNAKFKTNDQELAKFIEDVRLQMAMIVIRYVKRTSSVTFIVLTIRAILLPVMVTLRMCKAARGFGGFTLRAWKRYVSDLRKRIQAAKCSALKRATASMEEFAIADLAINNSLQNALV